MTILAVSLGITLLLSIITISVFVRTFAIEREGAFSKSTRRQNGGLKVRPRFL